MDVDDRLRALFDEDAPPARDPLFAARVTTTLARRRFLFELAKLSGVTFLGGLILWAVWPHLSPILGILGQGLAPLMSCVVIAATAVILADGHVASSAGLKHD